MSKQSRHKGKHPDRNPPRKSGFQWEKWLKTHRHIWLPALLGLYFLLGLAHFQTELSTIGDNAQFVVLAKALATGEGFREINSPLQPIHRKFPIGFPALLAIFYPFFHLNPLGYKIVVFLFSILGMGLIYRWFEDEPAVFLFPLLLLLVLNLKIHEYNSLILSEVPFLTFVVLGFVLFREWERRKKHLHFIFALLSFGVAYYLRSAGLVLFPAVIIYLLIRKNYRLVIEGALFAALLVAPWQIWLSTHGGSSYLNQLLMKNPYSPALGKISLAELFTQRLPNNAISYFLTFFPETILPVFKQYQGQQPTLFGLLGFLLSGAVLSGFLLNFWKRWDLKGWYFLGTLGTIALWPEVWASERFIFGIIPLILFYFLYAIHRLSRKLAGKGSPHAFFNFTVATYLVLLLLLHLNFRNPQTIYYSDWQNYRQCARWIKTHTPTEAVVSCRKPYLAYLWSNRRTVGIPRTSNDREVYRRFETNRVTHIIYDLFFWSATTRRYLTPVIQSHRKDFKIVYALKQPDTFVLEFLPGKKFLEPQKE